MATNFIAREVRSVSRLLRRRVSVSNGSLVMTEAYDIFKDWGREVGNKVVAMLCIIIHTVLNV